jgi:hypothetical protein
VTGHCRDCGEALDGFGICPFADVELVKLGRSPINCGHSAGRNAVAIAGEIAHALVPDPPKLSNFMGIAGDQSIESRRRR